MTSLANGIFTNTAAAYRLQLASRFECVCLDWKSVSHANKTENHIHGLQQNFRGFNSEMLRPKQSKKNKQKLRQWFVEWWKRGWGQQSFLKRRIWGYWKRKSNIVSKYTNLPSSANSTSLSLSDIVIISSSTSESSITITSPLSSTSSIRPSSNRWCNNC